MKRTILATIAIAAAGALPAIAASSPRSDLPQISQFQAGNEVVLEIEGSRLDGVLTQTDVTAGQIPGVQTLQADLADGYMRVATDGEYLSGVVATDRGTWWITDHEGELVVVDDADAAARIPASDRVIEPLDGGKAVDCSSLDWTPEIGEADTLLGTGDEHDFEVGFAVDELYVSTYGAAWPVRLAATINNIDAVLVRDTTINLVTEEVRVVPQTVVADTTSETLDRLQDHYVATAGGQVGETVFLFSGTDFTNAGGQVNCVGSAGRTSVSYGVASVAGGDYEFFGTLVLLPDAATKIGAHELAHTLSAHHHYANCVEAATVYNPVHTTDACTIMINDWGLIGLRFSSVSRLAMAGWADRYGI
ncbi:MAG: M12 family metallo-peptidase [Actinomycetota bacterium]